MRFDSNHRIAPACSGEISDIARRLRLGQLTRREAMRLLGGAGLAGAGMVTLTGRADAQDAGTPPPAVTPQIGPRADGSVVWRVKVADMRMDQTPIVELHAFFPGEITIAEGDAVWFDFGLGGFHTASFLSGGEVPPIFVPDPEPGTPEARTGGGTPAAAGAPPLILKPDVVFPQGCYTYSGSGYVSSGIDIFRDPAQPYVLTFTKAGTYDYQCDVHGEVMKAKIVVQPTGGAALKTQAEYDAASRDATAKLYAQADAEVAEYKEAKQSPNADGTTTWEATVGAGGKSQVQIQAFFPAELEVKVGDTVRWTHRAPGEPHTVSFIGAGEIPPEDPVGQFADGRPKFGQSPLTLLPQGGNVWHGKGWVSSGFIGNPEAGQATEFALTFDTPGEYGYFCFLHGDSKGKGMAAKLKVAPK
ncbi:MAG: cupredoxin domain-containing protein [Thermomicrobiales bacterium]